MEGQDHVSFSERDSYSDDMDEYSFGDNGNISSRRLEMNESLL